MGSTIFHSLREFVADYGYWAVALALLCENAGIPVPGETTLLLASFLAYSEHRLHLGWIIVVATCAATLGDKDHDVRLFELRPEKRAVRLLHPRCCW